MGTKWSGPDMALDTRWQRGSHDLATTLSHPRTAAARPSLRSSCLVLMLQTSPWDERIRALSSMALPTCSVATRSPSRQRAARVGPTSAMSSCVPQTIRSEWSLTSREILINTASEWGETDGAAPGPDTPTEKSSPNANTRASVRRTSSACQTKYNPRPRRPRSPSRSAGEAEARIQGGSLSAVLFWSLPMEFCRDRDLDVEAASGSKVPTAWVAIVTLSSKSSPLFMSAPMLSRDLDADAAAGLNVRPSSP